VPCMSRCIVVGGLATILAVSALSGCGGHGGSRTEFDREHSSFTPETIRSYSASPLYWLGTRFERWDLSAILGPSRSEGMISFIYGTCRPSDGEQPSCTPPIEVQVTPLCRHLASVTRNHIWRQRRIRGAPVGISPDGAPVLFSIRAQVKVYATPPPPTRPQATPTPPPPPPPTGPPTAPPTRATLPPPPPPHGLAVRALRALRSANDVKPVIGANEAIPPAPAAVLAGTRACS
jgi:hypothetical protein